MDGTSLWSVTISTVLVVITITGNSMAILAGWLSRGRKSIISKRLVLNLNISCLCVSLAAICDLIISEIIGFNFSAVLFFIMMFFVLCSDFASMLSVLTIAIDRYVIIAYPFSFRRNMKKKVKIAMILISWGLAFVISVTCSILFTVARFTFPKVSFLNRNLSLWILLGMNSLHLIIWIIMVTLYFKIWIKVRADIQKMKERGPTRGSGNANFSNKKVNQVVLTVLGCCSLCWLPFLITEFYKIIFNEEANRVWEISVYLILISNNAINPFIYSWMCPTYHEAFRRIVRCGESAHGDLRFQSKLTNKTLQSTDNSKVLHNVSKNTVLDHVDIRIVE